MKERKMAQKMEAHKKSHCQYIFKAYIVFVLDLYRMEEVVE